MNHVSSVRILAAVLWLSMLSVQAADDCGYHTTDLTGKIERPNSGETIIENLLCSWTITVPWTHKILLYPKQFKMNYDDRNMEKDWVLIESLTSEDGFFRHGIYDVSRKLNMLTSLENHLRIVYYHRGTYLAKQTFKFEYEAVPVSIVEMSTKWIKNNIKTILADKQRLALSVPALYLFDERYLNKANETGYKLRTQYLLHLSEDLLRNASKPLSLSDLSYHITAMMAICSNPRSFSGIDLVDHLRELVVTSPTFFKPYGILTLCNAGEKIDLDDILNLNRTLRMGQPNSLLLDFKALAVMALICVKAQENESAIDEILWETVSDLQTHQGNDGSFGSLHTTSLVYQALSAAGAFDWNTTSAFDFISCSNQTDGSFGNFEDLYAVLPTLKGKTLLDINSSNCDFSEDDVTPLKEVKNETADHISFTYQLWIGDEKDVKNTMELKFPNDTKFIDAMRLASEKDVKYRFKWTLVKDAILVYSISNIINNPMKGKYWQLYTLTDNQKTTLFKEGLEKYVPSDGDTAIMWYKTVLLE